MKRDIPSEGKDQLWAYEGCAHFISNTMLNGERSKSLTSFTSEGVYCPCQSLAATCPCCCILACYFFPNGALCPEFPQLLPALLTTTHETKPFMSSNILLQAHQVMATTQKVTPSFCSGPLFVMMGLIWGTEGNVALQTATAPSEILLGKYF